MATLQDYFNIVDQCIQDLGIDPSTTRGQKPGQWDLNKGSAKVWIDVWENKESGWAYIQFQSPIMKLPTPVPTGIFRELLEINDKLYGCAFTLYNEWVYIKSLRECEGLDKSEASAMLNRVGNYADQYDDYLKGKYGLPTSGGFSAPGAAPGPA